MQKIYNDETIVGQSTIHTDKSHTDSIHTCRLPEHNDIWEVVTS